MRTANHPSFDGGRSLWYYVAMVLLPAINQAKVQSDPGFCQFSERGTPLLVQPC